MTTTLEQGQKVLRGELSPPPIARLHGFVVKSLSPGHAIQYLVGNPLFAIQPPRRDFLAL